MSMFEENSDTCVGTVSNERIFFRYNSIYSRGEDILRMDSLVGVVEITVKM